MCALALALGKGEVVSSILTGSTTRKTKACNEMGKPDITRTTS